MAARTQLDEARVRGRRSRVRRTAGGALDAVSREWIIGVRAGSLVVSGVVVWSAPFLVATWRWGQPALPRSAGLWPGDMMMDWVPVPPGGRVRPLILSRPSDAGRQGG